MKIKSILVSMLIGFSVGSAYAGEEMIGSVDTAFKLFGPDHKIVMEVFDDPKVNGVSCYVS